ncbi:hypothetical protein BH11ARM2_BH11ARM2_31930 [soil metagenome]
MKKLIVFDLDGTLAESKSPVDAEMATLLAALLSIVKVAVISGGAWPQFENQVLSKLGNEAKLQNLSILPTCGTQFYRYVGSWERLYAEDFTAPERQKILQAFKETIPQADLKIGQTWGEQIEDRGSQITFSALGQQAPLEEKAKWDPDFEKRKRLQTLLDPLLSEFSVRLGGTTSVDVTKQGIDKAYGIRKLREVLGIEIHEMIFVGDALFPGGNDYPAKEAGVVSIEVKGPSETQRVILAIMACLVDSPSEPPKASMAPMARRISGIPDLLQSLPQSLPQSPSSPHQGASSRSLYFPSAPGTIFIWFFSFARQGRRVGPPGAINGEGPPPPGRRAFARNLF